MFKQELKKKYLISKKNLFVSFLLCFNINYK